MAIKGPDHLAPAFGHPGRFLGSTRKRERKFSEFAGFTLGYRETSQNLSSFRQLLFPRSPVLVLTIDILLL